MTRPTTWEQRVLAQFWQALPGTEKSSSTSYRLALLECLAAKLGKFDVDLLWEDNADTLLPADRRALIKATEEFAGYLATLPFHPTLALAALASPSIELAKRKKGGVFFTDVRLAKYLADNLDVTCGGPIIDPACGSGILLAASILKLSQNEPRTIDRLLSHQTFGVDKDPLSVRATRAVLSSLTSDKSAIKRMKRNIIVADSLLERERLLNLVEGGFSTVVVNPPWEKLKVTRHEFLGLAGVDRHYGADYGSLDVSAYNTEIAETKNYVYQLGLSYKYAGKEPDYYSLFLELCLQLVKGSGGQVGAIVPASLIRSLSAAELRLQLISRSTEFAVSLFDNKPAFFEIDSRFKFLTLHSRMTVSAKRPSISFNVPEVKSGAVVNTPAIHISTDLLRKLRSDLSLPEVRSQSEWALFSKIASRHLNLKAWGSRIGMSFCRELDMTSDRALFSKRRYSSSMPLVEGRMVHQFNVSAKRYVSGSGRKAIWQNTEPGESFKPQFWISPSKLSANIRSRSALERIGFCDITGQTNERSMLAAVVPPGVVCGNKVPTITFEINHKQNSYFLLGILNSFVFDWLLRRLITTTVNYFILESVPFPAVNSSDPRVQRLITLAKRIPRGVYDWKTASMRAELDEIVANLYGLSGEELKLVLSDFPLLDRNEPPLPGELRSSITRDLCLNKFWERSGEKRRSLETATRISESRKLGAVAYRPSHLVR